MSEDLDLEDIPKTVVTKAFLKDGYLSKQPNYHERVQQIAMAASVEEALHTKQNLVIEAGTGTGKTYGYLVPVLLSGKKAIVSTFTKNLQDQLFSKDLQNLQRLLGRSIKFFKLKGKGNYLCLAELEKMALHKGKKHRAKDGSDIGVNSANLKSLFSDKYVEEWATTDQKKIRSYVFNEITSGEVDEFLKYIDKGGIDLLSKEDVRNKLPIRDSICTGKACKYSECCFFKKAKANAKNAEVLVLNHSLLCAGQAHGSDFFPKVDIIVIDEAHKLPDVVRKSFASAVSTSGIKENICDVLLRRLSVAKEFVEYRFRTRPQPTMQDVNLSQMNIEEYFELMDQEEKNITDKDISTKEIFGKLKNADPNIANNKFLYCEVVFNVAERLCQPFKVNTPAGEEDISLLDYFKVSINEALPKNEGSKYVGSDADELPFSDLNIERMKHAGLSLMYTLSHLGKATELLLKCLKLENEKYLQDIALLENVVESISSANKFLVDNLPEAWNSPNTYEQICQANNIRAYRTIKRTYASNDRNFVIDVEILSYPYNPAIEFAHNFLLNEDKFDNSYLFTSATLAIKVDNSNQKLTFDKFKNKLGLDRDDINQVKELYLDSPFDYANNSILCTPKIAIDSNLAKNDNRAYTQSIIDQLAPVITTAPGGTFILTTSLTEIKNISLAIKARSVEYSGLEIIQQDNKKSPSEQIAEFQKAYKSGKTPVLIGTKSFWEGVDVQGAALSLVVITKIPFPLPDVHIKAEESLYPGYQGFNEVSLYRSIIDLKQGVGRLIRTETDKGAVIIYDSRLSTQLKNYSSVILDSMPPMKRTYEIADILELWKKIEEK